MTTEQPLVFMAVSAGHLNIKVSWSQIGPSSRHQVLLCDMTRLTIQICPAACHMNIKTPVSGGAMGNGKVAAFVVVAAPSFGMAGEAGNPGWLVPGSRPSSCRCPE